MQSCYFGKPYTKEELEQIKYLWATTYLSAKQIAQIYNRTDKAIQKLARVKKFGPRKYGVGRRSIWKLRMAVVAESYLKTRNFRATAKELNISENIVYDMSKRKGLGLISVCEDLINGNKL